MDCRFNSSLCNSAVAHAVQLSRLGSIVLMLATAGLTAPAQGQVQFISLRSGNGPVGGTDACVHVTIDGSPTTRGAVPNYSKAVVCDTATDTGVRLSTDPVAQPIGIPRGAKMSPGTVRFSSSFAVNYGPIVSAELELVAKADVGSERNSTVELMLNDRWIADLPLTPLGQPDEWFGVEQIGSFLNAGTNQLSLGVPGITDGSRFAFSARIRVRRTAVESSVMRSVATVSMPTPSANVAAADAAGACVGFTCRVRGDLDSVDSVALADHLLFIECLSGVGTPIGDDCEYADFDCDGHVDLKDTAFFQNAFSPTP